jgi:hypothetical protein
MEPHIHKAYIEAAEKGNFAAYYIYCALRGFILK